jgi:hypothetical protein
MKSATISYRILPWPPASRLKLYQIECTNLRVTPERHAPAGRDG